ncbi:MAG TPA: metal ABC transporter substrate-binding protein [Acidimicrobiales bacterium]|nr:metal ABC transporter substrate-binding protein [Acidimicrobiales bacterium]
MSISDRLVRAAGVIPLVAALAGLSGCSTPLPPGVATAPVLRVVTGLYPLARAATLIGQDKVSVTDVVPAGANPFGYRLGPAQVAAVHRAGLAVEIGGGFQPSFESAAAGARAVAVLGPAGSGATGRPGGYVWLDPASMGRAVTALAAAMEHADPGATALYRRNAASLQAQISSLGIDYSSTLATCPDPTLIGPDGAFGAMAGSYGLRFMAVGARPSPAATAAAVAALRGPGPAAVVAEPWVDNSGVAAVAATASARVHQLDTLAGAPSGGWPPGADYFSLMEQNLGTLSGALGCATQSR